ncbi:hypothetical protein B0H14DRAFT_2781253 [Mycena olivaceomarginata]|nr:hypothetical protein B0H14DRAFT_2781253 [Mycena olivaceomarginata]
MLSSDNLDHTSKLEYLIVKEEQSRCAGCLSLPLTIKLVPSSYLQLHRFWNMFISERFTKASAAHSPACTPLAQIYRSLPSLLQQRGPLVRRPYFIHSRHEPPASRHRHLVLTSDQTRLGRTLLTRFDGALAAHPMRPRPAIRWRLNLADYPPTRVRT